MPGSELDLLRDALDADGHGIAAFTVADDHVVAANADARALSGRIRAGQTLESIFDSRSAAKARAAFEAPGPQVTELQVERDAEPPIATRFLLLPPVGGERLFLSSKGAPTADEELGPRLMEANNALLDAIRDLSRRARDTAAERDALERVARLRELFITALAHDLRSPLNAILLTEARLLDDRADPEAVGRHVARIDRSVRRILDLIDTLLLGARLESTEPGLPTEALDLLAVAHDAIDALRPLAEEANVTLAMHGSPCPTRGNGVWLGEIFTNLVTNAIRHSPRGGTVAITVDGSGRTIRASVADQGPGIPLAQRDTIFEKYVQYGPARGSVGLGLYICRKIVALHGGTIRVEDAPGGGAMFVFEIPKQAAS